MTESTAKVGRDLSRRATLAGVVYQDLKDAILTGRLRADQRVTQRELSAMFNVSLTPVREALQRLASERYVVVSAHSDVRIAALDREGYGHLIQLIRVLDIGTMKAVLGGLPEDGIARLHELHAELERLYRANDLAGYLRQNNTIHHFIWSLYGNPFIEQTLVGALERVKLMATNYASYYTPRILARSFRQHAALLEAIAEGDGRKVTAVLKQHWDPAFFAQA